MSTQVSLVFKNAFNGETFSFPADHVSADTTSFDVVLEPGGSGGGNALLHVHPCADETFYVHKGSLEIFAGRDRLKVKAGQSFTVARNVPHYFKNAGAAKVEMTVVFCPQQSHRDFFMRFASLTEMHPEWFSAKGDPKILLIALFLNTFPDHLYLARVPIWLQRVTFKALAPIARCAGYRIKK